MELPGSEYLFELSTLAISFAAVSTLVSFDRRGSRGKPRRIAASRMALLVPGGLIESVAAVLPAVLFLAGLTGPDLWTVASGTAALLFAIALDQYRRWRFPIGTDVRAGLAFALRWLPVSLLVINIAVPSVRGLGLYAVAVAFSLGTAMWSFLRKVTAPRRDKRRGGWGARSR